MTEPESTTAGVTVIGGFAGTLGYCAPEQLRGEPWTARADVFALGCILYELLTGRRAFRGATPADIAASVLAREPAPLAALGAAVPPGLDALVFQCLRSSRAIAPTRRRRSRWPCATSDARR